MFIDISCFDHYKVYITLFRFWFQNTGVFSSAQVAELEKVTLSRVICDNADNMQFIAQDAFQFTSSLVGCNTLPGIDLSKWSD